MKTIIIDSLVPSLFSFSRPRAVFRSVLLTALLLVMAGSVLPAWAQRFPVLPINAQWRYQFDAAAYQCLDGSGWETPAYNDAAWLAGPGGFTGGETRVEALVDINTLTLPAPNSAGIAGRRGYFRTHFTLNSLSGLSLVFSNRLDDNAVYYLNGIEVARLRVTANPVLCTDFGTIAPGPNNDATIWEVITLSSAQLAGIAQVGDNVLAVTVGQNGATSSDLVFACSITGEIAFAPVIVQEPLANTTVEQCRTLTLVAVVDGAPPPQLQWFKNGDPIPGANAATLVIPNVQVVVDSGGYRLEAVNPLGTASTIQAQVTVVADVTPPTILSASSSPAGNLVDLVFSEPINPGSVDAFNFIVDGALGRVESFSNRTPSIVVLVMNPPLEPCLIHTIDASAVSDACAGNIMEPQRFRVISPLLLVGIDDLHTWRYDESGTDLGSAWRNPGYDDSAWLSGAALFGLEPNAGLPEPIRTALTVGTTKPTYYFRTHFTLPTDPSAVTRLQLRQVLDDGAVYYLNGVEVLRSRIAAGALDFNTLAVNQPVDPAQYEGPFDLPLAALRCGDNVLAVEVHQSSPASSDVVMGAELTATVPGGCIVRPCRRPAIVDFFPREGGEGTLLTIIGGPFHGGSPDNHCAILVKGNRFIDIEVLTASPTHLVARIGVIPPDCFGPLMLKVGVGDGARVPLCPVDREIDVADGNWVWRGLAADMVAAQQPFIAVQGLNPAGVPPSNPNENFHSGGPVGGMLMLTLDKDWGFGSRYCLSARIHAAGTGADTRIGSFEFTGVGSRFACAAKICDLLMTAFAAPPPANPPNTPLPILCQITTNSMGNPVITVWLASGVHIDGGNIDIIQKAPPPVIAGFWDIQNAGIWRKEIRAHEIARWYRHYNWTTVNRIWFERRAEGLWITQQALETFTCRSHCIYRLPNGGVWVIWRTFSRVDLRRFWAHYRFWWPGRLNPLLAADNPQANRTMMSMDELQIVLPMTPQDPNPATPFNEAVQIIDQNGQMHFQGQPGFEQMPDIADNPNGFQLATTAHSTTQLPPAAQRIVDLPMQPMPGMAQLQPGVIIQWLVDKNGNVLVDHNQDGWPDPLNSPHVLGNQRHPGLIAQPTGVAGNDLPVNFGNTPPQLNCWVLDPNGEVLGAAPGQMVVGPPVDLNLDGQADGPIGGPAPMDPTVRMPQIQGGQITEVRNDVAPVDIAVEEEGPPTDAQLAAMNQNLQAQIPGFVPLQRPFILCITRIKVRQWWGIDRRVVFDTWRHHWTWHHRNHVILRQNANRVWLTKLSLSHFHSSHHHYVTWPFPHALWTHFDLTHVRFFRICFRVIVVGPNRVMVKIDQLHVVVPNDPNDPNSKLALLTTQSDENKLFQEVPPAVLAGLQPDPLPVGPDGVFAEPIDPVAGTLDIGEGGAGVFGNRPLDARGMLPVTLVGNEDDRDTVANNQLQLYCFQLNPNGTIATESFAPGVAQPITFAISPAPAIPAFEDEEGNPMDAATVFQTTLTSEDNEVHINVINAGQAELTWDGPGQLEGAPTVTGPWANVPGGALSPVMVNLNTPMRYFRVRR